MSAICKMCGGNLAATNGVSEPDGDRWVKCDDCGDSGYMSEIAVADAEPIMGEIHGYGEFDSYQTITIKVSKSDLERLLHMRNISITERTE